MFRTSQVRYVPNIVARRVSHDCLFATASHDMRSALRVNDPGLRSYNGNRLMASLSSKAGINEPVFQLSCDAGSALPLQLGRFGDYTLNYHHKGAPRRYTVVKPLDHEAVEQLPYRNVKRPFIPEQERDLMRRPIPPSEFENESSQHPPSCTQFIRHRSTYVPCKTLELYGIRYTHFTQYEGEMISESVFPHPHNPHSHNAGYRGKKNMGYLRVACSLGLFYRVPGIYVCQY